MTRAVSETLDRDETLAPPIEAARSAKLVERPDSYLAWLEEEYGLGEISRFFADKRAMLDAGIAWQRLRGTPASIATALAWLGYDDIAVHDIVRRRRMWQRYQIEMGLVPAADVEDPLLYDSEYLARVSSPARSVFYRGFEGYDVRAMVWGRKRWGRSLWGADSGVRMPANGDLGQTKFSHGQDYAVDVTLTAAQKEELSINVVEGTEIGWENIPWDTPGLTWDGVADPKLYKAALLSAAPAYLGFFDAADQPIGYRRMFDAKDVTADRPPVADTAYVEFHARTAFGEGFGSTATQIAVLFHSRPADLTRPGKLWVEPGEIAFDPAYTAANLQSDMIPLEIAFRRTVREHVVVTVEA